MYGSLPADSKVKVALGLELAATWAPAHFIQMTRVNSCNGFAVNYSTVNITLIALNNKLFFSFTVGSEVSGKVRRDCA